MAQLKLTRRVYDAVCAHSDPRARFIPTGEFQPDGSVLVPVSSDVMERINLVRMKGETDSDVIERMIDGIRSGGRLN